MARRPTCQSERRRALRKTANESAMARRSCGKRLDLSRYWCCPQPRTFPGATVGAEKKTSAHRTPWTKENVRELKGHSKARTPLPEIAKKMKRTERALRRKAGILGIGLGHNAELSSRHLGRPWRVPA
jgi:hypothetical protein